MLFPKAKGDSEMQSLPTCHTDCPSWRPTGKVIDGFWTVGTCHRDDSEKIVAIGRGGSYCPDGVDINTRWDAPPESPDAA